MLQSFLQLYILIVGLLMVWSASEGRQHQELVVLFLLSDLGDNFVVLTRWCLSPVYLLLQEVLACLDVRLRFSEISRPDNLISCGQGVILWNRGDQHFL